LIAVEHAAWHDCGHDAARPRPDREIHPPARERAAGEIPNYEAMALATAARSAKTSLGFVLLKRERFEL
jgi:hypothetical protein